VWLPEAAFADAFAQNASPEEQAILAAVQRPLNVACIGVPVERPWWKDSPSWVLVAEYDRMINPETQLFQAERMAAHVRTRPVDHTPMVTAPADVVAIILDAARDVAMAT
jgi:pimeloyl-ACP methyl ester carboxylesterase